MPNWATSKLTITGDKKQLDELITQVSAPYSDDREGKDQMIEGNFLLWNIIRPTNLDQYYQRGEYDKSKTVPNKPTEERTPEQIMEGISEALDGLSDYLNNPPESLIEQIQHDFATGMDWYNWNVRNWGTKWEIDTDQSWINRVSDTEVRYELQTAWSPPVEALDNLAKQYPTLAFGLRSIDEGDLFAVEVAWDKGERLYEIDVPITHGTNEELHGYCWACEDGLEEPDNEDFDEDRHNAQEQYKCREFQNLDLEIELGLDNV
ncbi:hypothetical protein UFOVP115_101 [uncultured Caudovirales phage]|uniref:YubB ferredoxin-like domain-containing protein n=1 Tax=uncultured Caudovirales phage TaxID=2100421 RepID=A0A6J5LDE5_9CAUD|nr:hypothetical protein UFOVP115_101 [uncultured Caudovirales phage]